MLVFPDFQYLAEIPENTLRHIYVLFYEVIFFSWKIPRIENLG